MTMNHQQIRSSPDATIFLHELSTVKQWQREQTLGSGSFATITLWVNTETNARIALKQFRNQFVNLAKPPKHQQTYHERWLQEIKMMKQIKCENIVQALPMPKEFESLEIKTSILAMEFCSGGDLRRTLNRPDNCCGLGEKEVRQILTQISSAIIYLHELKIVHRDLKPENIVLQPLPSGKTLYKLTDLGYAKQFSDSVTAANSLVGTYEYLAPELFRGSHTSAVDNWSFGLMAFEIITGRRPFLPYHHIGTVLEVLEKKTSRDICTEMDRDRGFYFSTQIPYSNRICSTLKTDLEEWLRIVLEYDPAKRGGPDALKRVQEIMNKHTVQIFTLDTHELFAYEIDFDTTLDELKRKISLAAKVSPENQYLFLRNGEKPKTKVGQQVIDTWYTPNGWFERYHPIVIFMFDYSQKYEFQEFYKSLILPPTVESMLLDPTVESGYEEVRQTSRDSVFVVQKSIQKYSLLHEAFKSCILNSMSLYNELQDDNLRLYIATNELFTSINVLKKFVDANYYRCLMDLNDDGENVPDAEVYRQFYHKLKKLNHYRRDRILKHLDRSKQIVPRFAKERFIFEDFFDSCDINPKLYRKYLEIQSLYDLIRKQKKGEFNKHSSNQRMVNLLVECFELVQTLMSDMFAILFTLIEFIKQTDLLGRETRKCQKEVNRLKTEELEELNRTVLDLNIGTSFRRDHHHCRSNGILGTGGNPLSINEEIEKLMRDAEKEEQRCHTQQHYEFKKLEFCNFLF